MFNNFLIINKPTATLDQINLWAKGKPVLFRQAIPIAYRLSLQYGVDPVLTIAQIALETGYCRFGGKVSPSHHNTCGLKTKDGKAFHKFESWAQGIEAHVQHLALYANAPKLKGKTIVDPRHFESLRGTAKTVNDLSMKWATNSDYGIKLNKLCEEITKNH
jgi:flagellum-specific peptidoglycan hydrolase FlgJ